MPRTVRNSTLSSPCLAPIVALFVILSASAAKAQDWFKTETSSGAAAIRIAVADFKAASGDAQTAPFKRTFDTTLYSDLANAGIFDIVSKSLAPQSSPGTPAEMNLQQWSAEPASAAMVAFGSFGVQGGRLVANGFLFDVKNTQYPQVLAKQSAAESLVSLRRRSTT
jgi:TolB protein